MCIIIYKKSNIEFPTNFEQILETEWQMNPHGGGLAFSDNNNVNYAKGFMNFDDFIRFFKRNKKLLNKLDTVIHFRLASAGEISPAMCHPFSVKKEFSLQLEGKSESVLFHNGTISFDNRLLNNFSDSAKLSFILSKSKLEDDLITFLLSSYSSVNRFVYMTPKKTYTIGRFSEDQGLLYSNDRGFGFKFFGTHESLYYLDNDYYPKRR